MIERKWYVGEDRQGGSFGMIYGSMTADEWLDVATGWMDDDGAFDDEDGETEEEYRAYWQKVIDRDPQEFIDYFDDAWELTMVEGEKPRDLEDYSNLYYLAWYNGEQFNEYDYEEDAITDLKNTINNQIKKDPYQIDFSECYVESRLVWDEDGNSAEVCYIADGDPEYSKYIE